MAAPPPPELNLIVTGQRTFATVDLYHRALEAPWWQVLVAAFAGYLAVSVGFAGLYLLDPGGITGIQEPFDVVWFSVQTLSTIGYGAMVPQHTLTHVLVTLESFVGLLAVAMGTSLMFAKVSRPTARVKFSDVLVVAPYDGVPTLMFRMTNERRNQIVEAQLRISALMEERSVEGETMRRVRHLQLENERTPSFRLTWTAMHRLDASSPLYNLSDPAVWERVIALVVTFSGLDDTFHQTVHARHIYQRDQLRLDHRFVDIMEYDPKGPTIIHCELLSEIVAIPPA